MAESKSPSMASQLNNPVLEFFRTALRGYGTILFAKTWTPTLLFFAATFYDPFIGLMGVIGNITANSVAHLLHTDKNYIRAGVFGFNGILVGIGIGLYLPHSPATFLLIVLSASLSALISVGLLSILTQQRNLPILSTPFVLTTWATLLAARVLQNGDISEQTTPPPLLSNLERAMNDALPEYITALITAFGSTLFQPNTLSGLLVLIGILISSRISFAYGILGAMVGLVVFNTIGGDVVSSFPMSFTLNSILIAIALGGFFIVPNLSGALYTLFGVTLGVVIINAVLMMLKPFGLPALVAPFNLVTLLLLYPLRTNVLYPARIGLLPVPLDAIDTPEKNRAWYLTHYGIRGKVSYRLPFYGTWYVSQGEHGEHTHKGTQSFAYDFIVIDGQRKSYKGLGLALADYYCFGLPILAPAAGKVVAVVNHIADNQPGTVNETDNWGNYVILEHAPGEYTEISHFKQYSIVVKVGDVVTQGQLLGLCGNSGYSPEPHVHIQRQKGPFPTAETLPLRFSDLVIVYDGIKTTAKKTALRQGILVSNAEHPSATITK